MDEDPLAERAVNSEMQIEKPIEAAQLHIQLVTAAELLTAGTLGPLVTAFCTELGKRLGGNVVDWASRMRLRYKRDDPTKALLQIGEGRRAITIELDERLSDDAKLAMFELDVESEVLRGHRLRWDRQSGAWLPVNEDNMIASRPIGASVTVALIPKVGEELQRLQVRTGLSATDIVNRAITVYDFIDSQLLAGRELMVRDNNTGETNACHVLVTVNVSSFGFGHPSDA